MDTAWGLSTAQWSAIVACSTAAAALIALAASTVALLQLRQMAKDRQSASKLNFAMVTRESMTHLHSILAQFVAAPQLRRCFYENVEPEPGREGSALGIAEMLADTVESSLEIGAGMDEFRVHRADWTNYGRVLWDNSPSIRRVVFDADGWYNDYLAAINPSGEAELMCRALAMDPLWGEWVTSTEPAQNRSLRQLMAEYLRLCQASGWLATDPRGGIAAWKNPATGPPPATEQDEEHGAEARLGPAAFAGDWAAVQALFDEMATKRASLGPHLYLEFLGVLPNAQRAGIGTSLILKGLAEHDHLSRPWPVYLETFNRQNLAFYQRHGFETYFKFTGPRGVSGWGMLRPA